MSLGLGLMPRPQRFYFGFGPRIRTRHLQGRESDPKTLWRLREKVAAAIEGQIERMQRYRATDRNRNRSRLRRWLAPTV